MSKVSGVAYNEMSYLDKLDALRDVYGMSSSLAEAIGVSRRSLPNWRDRPESIKPAYRLNIDILCRNGACDGAWPICTTDSSVPRSGKNQLLSGRRINGETNENRYRS